MRKILSVISITFLFGFICVQTDMVLTENSIGEIGLPFDKSVTVKSLQKAFPNFEISKEIGEQDGPDFPLYDVKNDDATVLFFAMNPESTNELDYVLIKSPIVQDKYGLRVGDSYQKIKELRGQVEHYTDYHQHTYVYATNSNIRYEINGDVTLSADTDFENIKLTEEQIRDFKITQILWRQ